MNQSPLTKREYYLLDQLYKPRDIEYFAHWEVPLQENPLKTIARLTTQGLILEGDDKAKINSHYKMSELKSILKSRKISQTGSKDIIIQKILDKCPDTVAGEIQNIKIIYRSELGSNLVAIFNEEQARIKKSTEEQVWKLIQARKIPDAFEIIQKYESNQVLPKEVSCDQDYINQIFNAYPAILKKASKDQMEMLRIATIMGQLWGDSRFIADWLPEDFKLDLPFDTDTASRMILFEVGHKRAIANYKRLGIEKVQIIGCDDSCEICKKQIIGKIFKVSEVVELPYEHCNNSDYGCRCDIIALPDDEEDDEGF